MFDRTRTDVRLPLAAVCAAAFVLAVAPAALAGEAAAKLGGATIEMSEVDARAMAASVEPYQALYDARRTALEEIIADRLLEAEAKKQGVTKDQLIEREITAKQTTVDDAAVEAFYAENRGAMGGRSLEQMRGQIGAYLQNQSRGVAARAYINTLKAKSNVKVMLDPPRVEVTTAKDDPSKGPADAPVELVIYSEFQCPYCSKIKPTLNQIETTYGEKVRFVFRDYPLPFHNNAQIAAEAAQCAHEQDKFWAYHDTLFANQQALGKDQLKGYASEMGLDTAQFNECLDSGKYTERVKADHAEGSAQGVKGTPAFFVNGRFVSGALPFEAFQQIIDDELAR